MKISWDPGVDASLRSEAAPHKWTDVSAEDLLLWTARTFQSSISLSESELRFAGTPIPWDPRPVSRFETDPIGALDAARDYIEVDAQFRAWSGDTAEACALRAVHIDANAQLTSLRELQDELALSHVTLVSCYPPLKPVMAADGLREGAASDVIRSWLQGGIIVVGRTGLQAWPAQCALEAQASAAARLGYERFRSALQAARWTSGSGRRSLSDVLDAVRATVVPAPRVLLDPRIAEVMVPVTDSESLLSILDGCSGIDPVGMDPRGTGDELGWTWIDGVMVVTTASRELPAVW